MKRGLVLVAVLLDLVTLLELARWFVGVPKSVDLIDRAGGVLDGLATLDPSSPEYRSEFSGDGLASKSPSR